jgi:hypothetical protein
VDANVGWAAGYTGIVLKSILEVCDVLDREVATLVNEVKRPGTRTVQWRPSDVASGVYFNRLQAGRFTSTTKFFLTR